MRRGAAERTRSSAPANPQLQLRERPLAPVLWRSGGGVEADPGLVGQPGDPLGPQHRREGRSRSGSRRAGTTGTPSAGPCPRGPGRHGRRRSAAPPPRRAGPGRPGRPPTGPRAGRGRAGSGRATAARTGRAGAGPDTAWSRSRTPHRGRSPGDRGWPGCRERPGRAGPPTRAAPAGRAAGRCAAPPLPRAARRRRRGWAGTAAPSRPPPPASPPRTSPSRGASRLPSSPAAAPAASTRMAATRQGRVRVQAAHSAARRRRHSAWAEPPGRPTLARTRTATTGRSAPVPASRLVRVVVLEVGEDGLEVGLAERPHRAAGPILVRRRASGVEGLAIGMLLLCGASRRPALGLAGHAAARVAAGCVALAGRLALAGCGRRCAAWPGPARWRCGPAAGRPAGPGRGARGRGPGPGR